MQVRGGERPTLLRVLLPQAGRVQSRQFLVEAVLPAALGGAKGIAGNTTNGIVIRLSDMSAVQESEDGKLLLVQASHYSDADQTDRRFAVRCLDAVAAVDRLRLASPDDFADRSAR